MPNILDTCTNILFPMRCDVYYAMETQDKYGAVEKHWQLDGTINCSFYPLNDDTNDDNFSYDDKKFFRMTTILSGRVKNDIRKSSSGLFFPLSHILVTNVRAGNCEDCLLYYETNGDYAGEPTVFELRMVQPFVGPMNKPDYFRVQLERSDTQVIR